MVYFSMANNSDALLLPNSLNCLKKCTILKQ